MYFKIARGAPPNIFRYVGRQNVFRTSSNSYILQFVCIELHVRDCFSFQRASFVRSQQMHILNQKNIVVCPIGFCKGWFDCFLHLQRTCSLVLFVTEFGGTGRG